MNKILLILIVLMVSFSVIAGETNGYLSIKSTDAVEILVDGKLAGVVNDGQLFLELAAGTYEVTVQGYGFTPETIKNVKIEPLKATTLEISLKEYEVISEQLSGKLQIDLIHKYGTVRVFSLPFNGAQVTINGESYGETDIELTYFPAGQLSVEVEGPDKSKVIGSFFLEEKSLLTLLADFIDKQIYQLYEVSFDFPAGVEMMIDNTKIDRNTPSILLGETHIVELIARNSLEFAKTTKREIVISKAGYYFIEPDNKPIQEKMALVEKGSFIMGDTWGDGDRDEKPMHKVTFTYDFYIGKYETTFDEYDSYCEAIGKSSPDDESWGKGNRPVINVTWWDAIYFCNWLSEKEKLSKAYDENGNLLDKDGNITTDPSKVVGYRLPTEAEWEYAARGGNKSEGFKYAGSDNADKIAFYARNSGEKYIAGYWNLDWDYYTILKNDCKTHAVGTKPFNELGIYDMSGNVEEWCSDWWDTEYYARGSRTNPYNTSINYGRVVRGGSWTSIETGVRVTKRDYQAPTGALKHLGFRICKTVFYEVSNEPPFEPYNPYPYDEATILLTAFATLSWVGYDLDDDAMSYDVYLDTNSHPTTMVSSNQIGNSVTLSCLSDSVKYYWKVVARDSNGDITEGPVWKFTTCEPSNVAPLTVLVEKGDFIMGDTWGDGESNEKPTHLVTLAYDFHMGKYEVKLSEYDIFCDTTTKIRVDDENWGRGDRPVINVSWWDAIAYCNWLSEMEGLPKAYDEEGNFLDIGGELTTDPSRVVGYRLPTEAEWEYAARGGKESKGYKYAGSNNVNEVAWYFGNSRDTQNLWDVSGKTQEVGRKAPNELGIYDMSGNVWEWCSDWYGDYSSVMQSNPYCNNGTSMVLRGGSWGLIDMEVRLAFRWAGSRNGGVNDLGFRICRTSTD